MGQGRIGVSAVAVVALVIGLWAGTSQADSPDAAPLRVVVQEGDTVWDLALAHLPAGADLTSYVLDVAALNAVDPGSLRPGTILDFPR